MKTLKNNRNKMYGGAWSIRDAEALNKIVSTPKKNVKPIDFCKKYKKWISKNKNFLGWEDFKFLDYSNGTTETFDKFYQQYSHLRLRLFKGEYFYHQIQAKLIYKERFQWLDKEELKTGDVVVMSCPFSDTGNVPNNFNDILTNCDRLNIPVLLDMAYISISDIKELDLSHPSIQVITSSLSKVFPVENYRVGLRLRRKFVDDTLFAYNETQYVNRHSINVGYHLISAFDNDWLVKKYKKKQLKKCLELELEPSSCVIFGIDKKNKFSEYNRGAQSNRLCFSRIWDKRC